MRLYTFFFVTQSEKRGTLLLLLLIFILLLTRFMVAQSIRQQQALQLPALQEDLAIFDSTLVANDSLRQSTKTAHFIDKIEIQQEGKRLPKKQPKTNLPVELNTADTTLLKQLRGIGSAYANRIVRYRQKLGGFYSKQQLLEVYNFPYETYEKIENQLLVDTTYIQKLPINTLSIDELKRHPYIRYFQAKSLYENRVKRINKKYSGMDDIVVDRDVTPEFLRRIAPYLSFQ